MNQDNNARLEASDEQMLYASILNIGMYAGLAMLLITFALYVFGIVAPYIPVEKLSDFWTLSAHDFLAHFNIQDGWGWVAMLGYGDFLNFIGIAFLSGVTIICYAAIIPTLLRNKDMIYVVIAILEVIVLVAAASGFISVGGH
ncbi:MAG: hypothetical protein R6V41_06455 [Desulfobacteraceae bacterium]